MANNLYEYYQGQGKTLPSVQDRTNIATTAGISNYTGSASQNTSLLNYLQNNSQTKNDTITNSSLQPKPESNLTGITTPVVGSNLPEVNATVNAVTEEGKRLSEREKAQETLILERNKLTGDLTNVNTDIGNLNANQDRTKQDAAQKQVDYYSKAIESEQLISRRQIENLRNNPGGISSTALSAQIADIERKSYSKQADLALSLSAYSRDLSTAAGIADRQVQINLEQLTAKSNNLKLFIDNNKENWSIEDKRLYNEIQKKVDNELKIKTDNENTIKEIKLAAVAAGGQSVLSKLSAIDTSKTGAFDAALKIAAPYLAKTDTDIVKLDNGNTVIIDKKGNIIKNIGGAKASGQTFVQRTVDTVDGKKLISGYTIKPGDDNSIVAQLYGTDIATIKKLNPGIKDWNNLQPGQSINVPISKEDEFINLLKTTEGGSKLTDTSIQKLDKGLTVLNQLGVLQANIQDVKTGPIKGLFDGANPWNTKAQTIKTSLNAIVPNLARGIYGEVGVLTDNDINTYSKTIPNLKSTDDVRNAVLYITLDMIGKSIKNTLNVNAAAGRDVSGFIDIYTEMESAKNSILSTIPGSQIPSAFNKTQTTNSDPFLSKFTPEYVGKNISNSSFFNEL